MSRHKTKSVIIKKAKIDKLIIPVVNWLNEFEYVFTKWSCEGGGHGHNEKPYVVFSCDSAEELAKISRRVGDFGQLCIRPPYNIRLMDYSIEFISKKALKVFISVIKFGDNT